MNNQKAIEWIGIITVLQDNGYLSISTAMDAFSDVARKYSIKHEDMTKLVNETQPKVDKEASDVSVYVEWLDMEGET